MPQFDVSSFSSQLFWLAITFTALYFIVSRFIAPKAESILTARNRCMEEDISYASDYKQKAETLEIEKQEKLTEVNARVEDLQQRAVSILEAHFSTQREELAASLDHKKQTALAEIDQYVDKFHTDEPDSCVSLAAFIIQKVTNKSADLKLLKEIHSRAK
jgi:F-type H+-transporting ATPase subunit b